MQNTSVDYIYGYGLEATRKKKKEKRGERQGEKEEEDTQRRHYDLILSSHFITNNSYRNCLIMILVEQ